MQIVLFEDEKVHQLNPITLMRPSYTISCGAERLVDWALSLGKCVRGSVRAHLRDWQAAEFSPLVGAADGLAPTLLVNARVAPLAHNFQSLAQLVDRQEPCLLVRDECLVAGFLPRLLTPADLPQGGQPWSDFLSRQQPSSIARDDREISIFDHPHEVIKYHVLAIGDNLQRRLEADDFQEVREGVFVKGKSPVNPWIYTDTTDGPIVIDEEVTLRPFACLHGPVYLGPYTRVNEHSVIKNGVSVGAHCKIGGEVGASIVESFSNKQHHGYLGHAYVGQWVNLGAGTSNSNLKNTYGTIRMEVDQGQIETGMQFLGCVIGDFAKSAINTAIFTGKRVGVCSTLYGFVTTNVPSFCNYARTFGQVTEMNPDVVALMQRRAFARRGLEQQTWHVQLLNEVYKRVASGRELADKPVSL